MKKTNVFKLKKTIMKIKKNILKDKIFLFYVFLIIFSIIYLLVYYKNVGIHDVGAYIQTGKMLIEHENPYKLYGAKWGTFGPIVLLIIYSLIPKAIAAAAFQLINLLGIFIFYRIFINKKENAVSYLVFILIVWLSPIREMLAINQITGIILGCVALGRKFLPSEKIKRNSFKNLITSAFFFSIAIDLKPHTIIFVFIIIILLERSIRLIGYTTIVLFITHSIINLYSGSILELDWLKAILTVSSSASENKLGDSVSFWPIFNNYFDSSIIFYVASMLLVLVLFIVSLYFAYKRQSDMAIFFAFLTPSLSIYYHFYDLIPLCIIALNWAILNRQYFYSSFILSFILIPKEYISYRNSFLVLIFELLLLFTFIRNIKQRRVVTLSKIVIGVSFSYMLHLFNSYLNFNPFLLQSLIVSETLLMIYFVIYLKIRKPSVLMHTVSDVD